MKKTMNRNSDWSLCVSILYLSRDRRRQYFNLCQDTNKFATHTIYYIIQIHIDINVHVMRIWTITVVRIVFYEFRRHFRHTKSIRVISPVLSKTFSFYVAIFMNCKQLYTAQTTGIIKTETFFVSFSQLFLVQYTY